MAHVPLVDAQSPPEQPLNWPALIETALLGSAATVLITKTLRGVLVFYIHPRYAPLILVAGLALAFLALVRMRAIAGQAPEPLAGRTTAYAMLGLAILAGTLVPARPLGASAISSVALLDRAGSGLARLPAGDSRQWDLLQWATAISIQGDQLQGSPVEVVGFVYHEPDAEYPGFVVARYVVSCCIADGSPVGLAVIWPKGAAPPADAWVRVRGVIGLVTRAGRTEPAIVAELVEPISQPRMPYLYDS